MNWPPPEASSWPLIAQHLGDCSESRADSGRDQRSKANRPQQENKIFARLNDGRAGDIRSRLGEGEQLATVEPNSDRPNGSIVPEAVSERAYRSVHFDVRITSALSPSLLIQEKKELRNHLPADRAD
ncbi:unnamed protein product [Pleuronectes platessa]|uniref:Uncharacterized protein n=1 Tax=Pleuronectes platessa TaxID=8262 RepID=A0A9N7V399_PLEPL|nr:unnamed protein product [Pleuronectes platessa]